MNYGQLITDKNVQKMSLAGEQTFSWNLLHEYETLLLILSSFTFLYFLNCRPARRESIVIIK